VGSIKILQFLISSSHLWEAIKLFMQSYFKTILFVVIGISSFSCSKNEVPAKVDCAKSDLAVAIASQQDASGCTVSDGRVSVNVTGGTKPYNYNLNGGNLQTSADFLNVGAGSYNIKVRDANFCERTVPVDINAANSTLDATTSAVENTKCNAPNGIATVTGKGGDGPYTYLFGSGSFTDTNVFTNLKEGTYFVTVKDFKDCQKVVRVTVPRGNTGTSYLNDIKPIITTACALPQCHDANEGDRSWTTYDKVKAGAAKIKSTTSDKSMPKGTGPKLTQEQINLIACWVDDGALNN
jgi:SprB repeat